MRGHDCVLYVHWSSGIGGGSVVGGSILSGASGSPGEIGHVSIDHEHGRPCYCGGRGCLEMYAGLEVLLVQGRQEGLRLEGEKDLLTAVASGEAVADRIVEEAAVRVGRVAAGAAVLLEPDLIVLGNDYVAGHREELVRLLQVLEEANDCREANMDETITLTAAYLNVEGAKVRSNAQNILYPSTEELVELSANGTVGKWRGDLAAIFVNMDKIEAALPVEEFFDAELWGEAYAR